MRTGPDDATEVTLDTTLYLPKKSGKKPAILLAHGFGGTKRVGREPTPRTSPTAATPC